MFTCLECLQMLHPVTDTPVARSINNTPLANASIRVRDALLHEAILCLSRVLDKKRKERECLETLIDINANNPNSPAILKKIENVRSSSEWVHLIKIRHGRIGHNLNDRGDSLRLEAIRKIFDEVWDILQDCAPDAKLLQQKKEAFGFWNQTARTFWKKVCAD